MGSLCVDLECMCQIENVTMATLDNDNTYISVVVTPSQVSDEVVSILNESEI